MDLVTRGHNLLFLDTSLPFFSCGFLYKEHIQEEFYPLKDSHSIGLEERIEKFISKYKLKLTDFDDFIYNSGPGSFTGLRIGAAFLKGLTSSLGRSLFYIPLNIIIKNMLSDGSPKTVYIRNAKKREFYFMIKGMDNFSMISIKDLESKFSQYKILYDGNLEYEFKHEDYHILPKYFIKNIKHAKIIKKGILIFSYINNPDIR